MAKKYLENLFGLIKKVFPVKARNINLDIKHFFSGAAVYANGKICITLSPVGFALKLPQKYLNKLEKRKGVKELRYFPGAPVKKDYVVLPKVMVEDLKTLRRLIKISINYAITLKEWEELKTI